MGRRASFWGRGIRIAVQIHNLESNRAPLKAGPGKHRYKAGANHSLASLLWLDLLPAKNGEEQTVQFLLEVVDILLNYVRKTFDRSTKVLDFHHPHQLLEGMEGFNLELSDHPESLEQILVDCRDTLKYGVRTGKREEGLVIRLTSLIRSMAKSC